MAERVGLRTTESGTSTDRRGNQQFWVKRRISKDINIVASTFVMKRKRELKNNCIVERVRKKYGVNTKGLKVVSEELMLHIHAQKAKINRF